MPAAAPRMILSLEGRTGMRGRRYTYGDVCWGCIYVHFLCVVIIKGLALVGGGGVGLVVVVVCAKHVYIISSYTNIVYKYVYTSLNNTEMHHIISFN